ncbi:branched-chain amino acid ABC transporter substrate-binding protein [Nocardioides terrisoli]|uniref:branched-chain amino acid ABC transporter substrate-binding protein n=1 Tax=Nocardioides terrisoli TaxID=3388267 RepID=UPI00287B79FA|nr:branched-chain amino acid ABC transporter substrate-binding protein [Nocardioides marmorisolisilvae]
MTAPLSGSLAASGTDTADAAELAAKEVNDAGGISGRDLKVIPQDDQCDAQAGVQAAQKLLQQKVVAIVGGYCSAATIPEVGVLEQAGNVPFVAGLSSAPELTEKGYKNIFRVASRDDRQGPAIAEYVRKVLGVTKLAVVSDGTTYGVSIANQIKKMAGQLGLDIVFDDAITPGQKDYTTTLTKVGTTPAEALVFTGQYPEFGLLIKEWASLGQKYKLVGNDSDTNEALFPTAGPAVTDSRVSFVCIPNGNVIKSAQATAFDNAFKKEFGRAPDAFAVAAYDSMMTLVQALKDNGGKTGASDLDTALHAVHYNGITGPISFDAKGDRPATSFYALHVEGNPETFVGKYVYGTDGWKPLTAEG